MSGSAGSSAGDAPGDALYASLLAELSAGLQLLPDKPEESADSALRALWLLAAGQRVSAARALEIDLPALDAESTTSLRASIAQRLAGVPLAHLTQRQRFMGLEMLAGPDALIPRAETELLGHAALALVRAVADAQGGAHVIDVCTGSGNVAAALAAHEPRARVFASDLSPEAVALAARNVVQLGLASRVTLGAGDLLAPFDSAEHLGRVDVLSCNPPYISSGRMATMPDEIIGHEPKLAFDGGPLGIRILQRLIREAPRFLREGGWLVFEVGLGQGPAVAQRLKNSQLYTDIDTVSDAAGEARVLRARLHSRSPA